MSLKAIVTDGRGAILRSTGRIVTYSPECWKSWKGGAEVVVHEFRPRAEDDFSNLYPWDENGRLYEKTVKTALTVYVDSVSGATEAGDTGDGTQDNPFSCLNSALHFLEPPSWSETRRISSALATGCYCSGTPVVKIFLTGKVDYSCAHHVSWALVYIEGDNAEFEVESDEDWRFGDTVANCRITVSGDERDYGFYAPAIFENCEIYSAFGLGSVEGVVYHRNEFLLYGSDFHLTTNSEGEYGDGYLGFMYNSNIYIEPGGPPPDPDPEVTNNAFYLLGANACHNFYKSNRKAEIICFEIIDSTIGGNAVWG